MGSVQVGSAEAELANTGSHALQLCLSPSSPFYAARMQPRSADARTRPMRSRVAPAGHMDSPQANGLQTKAFPLDGFGVGALVLAKNVNRPQPFWPVSLPSWGLCCHAQLPGRRPRQESLPSSERCFLLPGNRCVARGCTRQRSTHYAARQAVYHVLRASHQQGGHLALACLRLPSRTCTYWAWLPSLPCLNSLWQLFDGRGLPAGCPGRVQLQDRVERLLQLVCAKMSQHTQQEASILEQPWPLCPVSAMLAQ